MAKSARFRSGRGGSLRRPVAVRAPKRTFFVFCEGSRTEPAYLRALKRESFIRDVSAIDIQIDERSLGSVPLTLVEAAVRKRERFFDKEAEIDEMWCVFDVEWPRNHPNLRRAIALAREHDVQVAVSNPCFELWLVLHFQEQSAWLNTSDAIRLRRRLDGSADKGLDSGRYMSKRGDATRRAFLLDKRHRANGTEFPKDNPSSGMHRLLQAIEPLILDQ